MLKVLTNKLKLFLPSILFDSHSGFVPERLITNNVIISHKLIHYLRHKRLENKGLYVPQTK